MKTRIVFNCDKKSHASKKHISMTKSECQHSIVVGGRSDRTLVYGILKESDTLCNCPPYSSGLCTDWRVQKPEITHTHTHTHLTTLCPGLHGWASTRKVKNQSGFYWSKRQWVAVESAGPYCKSAPHSRQITTPAPHHSVFYRPDALPAAQPTVSKHWRHQK